MIVRLAIGLSLSAALIGVAGCGTSSAGTAASGRTSDGDTPTATPSDSASPESSDFPDGGDQTLPDVLASPYIAVLVSADPLDGIDRSVAFFNPGSGEKIFDIPLLTGDQLTQATNAEGDAGRTAIGLDNSYQMSPDFTYAVDLDSYANDVVPAKIDLESGTVTDLVAPSDPSGFENEKPVVYIKVGVNPGTGDIWAVHSADDSGNYQVENLSEHTSFVAPDPDYIDAMYFVKGQDRPVFQYDLDPPPAGSWTDQWVEDVNPYSSRTRLDLGPIRRSVNGDDVAFTGKSEGGDVAVYVAAPGDATPTKVADLSANDSIGGIMAFRQ